MGGLLAAMQALEPALEPALALELIFPGILAAIRTSVYFGRKIPLGLFLEVFEGATKTAIGCATF